MLKSFLKLIRILMNLAPSAIELLSSKEESKKMDSVLEFVKAIEKRLDDIYANVIDKIKKLILWILLLYLTQVLVIVLLLILLIRSCSIK